MPRNIRKLAICISVLSSASAWATVYRVNSASTATNPDGSSWTSAFKHLQDALNVGLVNGDEVWVAGGQIGSERTYYPDETLGEDSNDSAAAFQLPQVPNAAAPGIRILGGFAGTEISSSTRDVEKYITILSGDIDKDGILDADNSWHVVRGTGVPATSRIVLDGFTITMGYADGGTIEHDSGAGISVYENDYAHGNPQIVNCVIESNYATWVGGGAHFYHAKGSLINCIFRDNATENWGGGIYIVGGWDDIENSTPDLVRCQFINNSAKMYGGGVEIANASPTLTNCLFFGNKVTGGDDGYGGGALHMDCTDTGDAAGCETTDPVFTNCTFAGNTAIEGSATGGGVLTSLWTLGANPQFVNCIFHGNDDSSDESTPGEQEAANLLHTGNQPPAVTESLIEVIVASGAFDHPTNIDGDPLFVAAEAQNYRLQAASTCIDNGSNEALPGDTYDLDDDNDMIEPIPFDLARLARLADGPNHPALGTPRDYDPGLPIVDMGAYEYHPGGEVCEGDANGDSLIDPLDAGFVLSMFNCQVGQGDDACDAADVNLDGIVDPLDVGYVLTRFGPCAS